MGATQFTDTKGAAAMLGVHVNMIYKYLRLKKLRSVRPGSTGQYKHGGARHLIPVADVRALLTVEQRTGYEASDTGPIEVDTRGEL